MEHFAQEICTECDQKLLRIGSNLYTLHNAVTCVKFGSNLDENDCRLIKTTESDVKHVSMDSWKYEKNFAESDDEVAADDCKIKIESTSVDDTEQITFDTNYDESIESSDIPSMSSCVKSTTLDHEKSIETIQFNEIRKRSLMPTASHHSNTAGETLSNSPVFHTKCGICNELFLNSTELDRHMRGTHSISDGYECDICLKKIKTKNGLHIHKRYAHDEANIWKFKCDTCDASFMKESSINQHTCGDKLKCEFDHCDKTFHKTFALRCHMAFKHRKGHDTVTYVCKLCTRTFETAEQRDEHRSICSYKRNIRVSKICGELWCDLCIKKFANNSLLRQHIQTAHSDCEKFDCTSCCAVFMQQSSYHNHFCTNPLIRKPKQRVSCPTCGKMLCGRIALHKHTISQHSSSETIFCTLCAQTFETQEERAIHRIDCLLKKKMQRYKRIECHLCDFIAKSQISLRNHITKNHKKSDL